MLVSMLQQNLLASKGPQKYENKRFWKEGRGSPHRGSIYNPYIALKEHYNRAVCSLNNGITRGTQHAGELCAVQPASGVASWLQQQARLAKISNFESIALELMTAIFKLHQRVFQGSAAPQTFRSASGRGPIFWIIFCCLFWLLNICWASTSPGDLLGPDISAYL